MSALKKDLGRLVNRDVGIYAIIKYYFLHMGFRAVALYRISDYFSSRKLYLLAKLIRNHNIKCTGAEFCLGCKIGPGLVIQHPNGIVIGGNTYIGINATILQQVTCGENYKDDRHDYPYIGDNVVIGAGAKVLGGVKIGDNCKIGANSVVVHSFPDGSTIAGIPGRRLNRD
ncbi:MAG: serine O-acetyltransferase [Clostridia bacterium]|nr:serine O-acetyltransferase [Clostridia bacterium]